MRRLGRKALVGGWPVGIGVCIVRDFAIGQVDCDFSGSSELMTRSVEDGHRYLYTLRREKVGFP